MPGHKETARNETADIIANWGAENPFLEPESACGISGGSERGA
jgi:hypothetical protein